MALEAGFDGVTISRRGYSMIGHNLEHWESAQAEDYGFSAAICVAILVAGL